MHLNVANYMQRVLTFSSDSLSVLEPSSLPFSLPFSPSLPVNLRACLSINDVLVRVFFQL